jgi:hypothetical protein
MQITELTISDLLSSELTRRLSNYNKLLQEEHIDRDTANHRYLCLQTALWMDTGADEPAVKKTREAVLDEMRRWRKVIQADSTVDTMHVDGRKVQLINEFIETHRERQEPPEQTQLF